jgi:hypothetical protein
MVGDRHALTFKQEFMVPPYHRGVMMVALEMSEAKNPA